MTLRLNTRTKKSTSTKLIFMLSPLFSKFSKNMIHIQCATTNRLGMSMSSTETRQSLATSIFGKTGWTNLMSVRLMTISCGCSTTETATALRFSAGWLKISKNFTRYSWHFFKMSKQKEHGCTTIGRLHSSTSGANASLTGEKRSTQNTLMLSFYLMSSVPSCQ